MYTKEQELLYNLQLGIKQGQSDDAVPSKICSIYILRLNVRGTFSGLDYDVQIMKCGKACFPHVVVSPCLVRRTLSFRTSNDSPTN
jgi:hypothetical protein